MSDTELTGLVLCAIWLIALLFSGGSGGGGSHRPRLPKNFGTPSTPPPLSKK